MATLEDKILNGPTVHYCDAGDDDIRHDEIDGDVDVDDDDKPIETELKQMSIIDDIDGIDGGKLPTGSAGKWTGVSRNTGPKGVIADQLDSVDIEIAQLMEDDECLRKYMKKRLQVEEPEFGDIRHIKSGEEFLTVVDKEHPNVLVVVHVYVRFSRPCLALNRSLELLANQYRRIRFVTLDASVAGMSANFKDNGVPALLVYKNGNLVKSLVRLTEELDQDFEFNQLYHTYKKLLNNTDKKRGTMAGPMLKLKPIKATKDALSTLIISSIAMITLPLISYYLFKYLFNDSTTGGATAAIITVHVILALFVYRALNEKSEKQE